MISGGQTGADQGGLLGAGDAGVATGGTAPLGFRTEDGPAPWLADMGLVESPHRTYRARTRANVEAADGTVLFGAPLGTGSRYTREHAARLGKAVLHVPWRGATGEEAVSTAAATLAEWLAGARVAVLNVAGNRESGNPGIAAFVRAVVARALVPARQPAAVDGERPGMPASRRRHRG